MRTFSLSAAAGPVHLLTDGSVEMYEGPSAALPVLE